MSTVKGHIEDSEVDCTSCGWIRDRHKDSSSDDSEILLYSTAIVEDSADELDFVRRSRRLAHDLCFVNESSAGSSIRKSSGTARTD